MDFITFNLVLTVCAWAIGAVMGLGYALWIFQDRLAVLVIAEDKDVPID